MTRASGEIYGAVYDAALEIVQDEVVMPFEAWIALPAGDQLVLAGTQFRSGSGAGWSFHGPGRGHRGKLPHNNSNRGARKPAMIDANYVRRSDAELLWRDPASR